MIKQPFERTSPEAVGIPSYAIQAFLNNLKEANIELHSLMILRHNKVCAEGWWKPYSADKIHNIHSFTKTFVASAFGMLVHEGKASVEDYVLSYFPEEAPDHPSEYLKQMKVRHLLSMSTGHHTEPRIHNNPDFVKAFFAWPIDHEPGTYFCYNSCATHIISRIIHKITGQNFVEFLTERLFIPMGFGQIACSNNADGFPSGGGGMALTTEDMTRLAALYLQKGNWNGKQLVPKEWIDAATIPQSDNSNGIHIDNFQDWEAGYGYQLWMNDNPHSYRFDGAFGQVALVCPDEDLAVVFTASTTKLASIINLNRRFLLKHLSESALPENPGAWNELKDRLSSLALPELISNGTSFLQDAVSQKKLYLPENNLEFVASGRVIDNIPVISNVTAITPVFDINAVTLLMETKEGTLSLIAGMNGEAIANTFMVDGEPVEFYASAKWLDQNQLSVTWRLLRIVRSANITITYHLTKADVSLQYALWNEAKQLTAAYLP